MSVSADLEQIEPRISSLVARHAGAGIVDVDDDSSATGLCGALRPTMDAVAAQALTSSEGGKRLRALLTLAAHDAVAAGDASPSPARDAVLDVACAIEVFQTAALVHDDIIDDSDLRRGKPSAHRALSAMAGDDAVGEGLGIMLGDLLATACIGIVNAAATSLPHSGRLLDVFLRMQREVEVGQILDLSIETMALDDPAALAAASLDVFRWKTASYTTVAPLELGFLAAGMAPADAHRHAVAVGRPLGVAFQLADDLLDVAGSPGVTGKPVGGDIREGKRNVLLADALAALGGPGRGTADGERLKEIFTAVRRTDDDVEFAIATFRATGAIGRSEERIRDLWRESCRAMDTMELDRGAAARLKSMCARFLPADLVNE
ncbi:polyprenyl synthetase family protein [Bifidobacterium choloepi]|uniref:Polyprenyl synthetase family protein n=1 Tax=Bifidobacterium choloepi TaxID=2614131 RepID=A0A6I5N100_9BIFI|nr:polyprenyl synthetase family protein [Bifidobacterium choloepi]NEG70136.1 polyprenyl synthetase family protein [Bifidobacterium choloepi]